MKKIIIQILLSVFYCTISFTQTIDSTFLKHLEEKLQKERDEIVLKLGYETCCFRDDCNENELIWNTLAEFLKRK